MTDRTVSHYRILNQIGSGGMGVVFRAVDTRLGREVAVKFLLTAFARDRAAIRRFQREARMASSLNHPNICAVHDVGDHQGQPFIVMPLLRGCSLRELIADRQLPIADALDFAVQIADALETAHAGRILHRDIKPANIFVTDRNQPMLLDFGIAKLSPRKPALIAADAPTESANVESATADAGLGTVAYMSPEQVLGEHLDARSDIFALGVTLYETLTFTAPFTGATSAAVVNEILNKTPVLPSVINGRIPLELDRVLARALEKDRSLRHQTAADLQAELKRVVRALRDSTRSRSMTPRGHAPSSDTVAGARSIFPTEAINPVSITLDQAPVPAIIDMIVHEDRKVVAAVESEREHIAQGVEIVTNALRSGGRVIFVGAGTSGRLGVLEATEMAPTFNLSPRAMQAIMAGGRNAFFDARQAVSTEDDYEAGARSVVKQRVTKKDVVVGVSASGKTPFVRGALARSSQAGARTIFVSCWPGSELQTSVDLTIAPAVGPEIIAGSTRLKAGTATKMVLNMLTTIAMVRLGKTYGNLMVEVQAGSEKLKDRARRIFSLLTGASYTDATVVLRKARWNVKAALVMQKTGSDYAQAMRRLRRVRGSMREAIGEDIETRLREVLRLDRVGPE